ncbi:MAG: glycerophosphodiester phosphodiesterase [Actinobacteria bacterium]|nr:glycerophosphodiester phosphodiesterase [Actinomycetota bacterium]MCI0544365.1 glycerophosphodiester phosphodiesterase [Actinomycetota bacterium]
MRSSLTRPSIVGHRGWPTRFPDNCLTGLLQAATVADMVEVDVRRCGDGKLILSHDPVIDGHVVVSTPWSTLADLDIGDGHHPALLDEALAALASTPMMIEIKNSPDGFEPDHRLGLEAAERSRAGDLVTSLNWDTVDRVRSVYPEVATGLVVVFSNGVDTALRRCAETGHHALALRHEIVVGPLPGVEIYAWTVDDPDRARELAAMGVSGIITDRPDLIREAL